MAPAISKPVDSCSYLEPSKYQSTLITSSDDPRIQSYGEENKFMIRPVVCRNPQMVIDELLDDPHLSDDFRKNQDRAITKAEGMSVDDATSKNIDIVTVEKCFSSIEKRARTRRRRKHKMDLVTHENIKQHFGKPIEEASRRLGVSRSTLKRVCRKFSIASWPIPNRNKKAVHFGIYGAVFLLIRVKRWSCSSNGHGFSGKWWICGKHKSFISRSNPSLESAMIRGLLPFSQALKEIKEPDESTETMAPFSRLVDGHISDTYDVFHQASTSPKKLAKVSDDCRMVTVKATYKNDMIKFRIPISSGLLELENQVARRIKLTNTKFHLKYRDEDDDLILIACDADFHNLMSSQSAASVSNNTVKLIVQIAKS